MQLLTVQYSSERNSARYCKKFYIANITFDRLRGIGARQRLGEWTLQRVGRQTRLGSQGRPEGSRDSVEFFYLVELRMS